MKKLAKRGRGGAWAVCRFKGEGGSAKKEEGGFEWGVDALMHIMPVVGCHIREHLPH